MKERALSLLSIKHLSIKTLSLNIITRDQNRKKLYEWDGNVTDGQ